MKRLIYSIMISCLIYGVSFAEPKENVAVKRKDGVLEFKQLSVEGTIQRPSAAYLLQRRKLKFRGIEAKKSFIPLIIKSVKRSPF